MNRYKCRQPLCRNAVYWWNDLCDKHRSEEIAAFRRKQEYTQPQTGWPVGYNTTSFDRSHNLNQPAPYSGGGGDFGGGGASSSWDSGSSSSSSSDTSSSSSSSSSFSSTD